MQVAHTTIANIPLLEVDVTVASNRVAPAPPEEMNVVCSREQVRTAKHHRKPHQQAERNTTGVKTHPPQGSRQ